MDSSASSSNCCPKISSSSCGCGEAFRSMLVIQVSPKAYVKVPVSNLYSVLTTNKIAHRIIQLPCGEGWIYSNPMHSSLINKISMHHSNINKLMNQTNIINLDIKEIYQCIGHKRTQCWSRHDLKQYNSWLESKNTTFFRTRELERKKLIDLKRNS